MLSILLEINFYALINWRELSPSDKLHTICPFSRVWSFRAIPTIKVLKSNEIIWNLISVWHCMWQYWEWKYMHIFCKYHIVYPIYKLSVFYIYDGIFNPLIYLHETVYMTLSNLWALRGEPGRFEQWWGWPSIQSMTSLLQKRGQL